MKRGKRFIAVCIAASMLLFAVPSIAAAEGDSHTYDNGFCSCGEYQPAERNSSGVYEIGNAGQLYWFARQVNNGNGSIDGKLTANIVVNEDVLRENGMTNGTPERSWSPIGSNVTNKMYIGTFDGAGHTVSGLYYVYTGGNNTGLFGYLDKGGIIKNVGVIDSYFYAGSYVGGVVGYNNGGTVQNCWNASTVGGYGNHAGGVVGWNYRGTVMNCYNAGKISITGSYVGGVVGNNYDTIENCYNTGAVSGLSSSYVAYSGMYAGGITGYNSGTIKNCYNASSGTVTGTNYIGGVVGQNIDSVTSCYNIGAVTTSGDYVGGVAGRNTDTITNSYYLNTSCKGGINGSDASGSAEARTADQFKSGEVAYLLQDAQATQIWGQDLDNGKTVQTAPTFTGDAVYTLKNCSGEVSGYTNSSAASLEKPEHIPGDPVEENRIDSTCMDTGSYDAVVYCSVCKTYKMSSTTQLLPIDPNNHTKQNTTIKDTLEPTCGVPGYTGDTYCECGDKIADGEVIPATGAHSYTVEVEGTKVPATCMAAGSITMKCANCDATEVKTLPIDKTNHTKQNTTVKDVVEASCGGPGYTGDTYCECGEKIASGEVISAKEHVYDTGVITTQPGCETEGVRTFTCVNDSKHTYTEVVAPTGHTYTGKVTPPTCAAAGYTTYTCACGDTYTADEVAALGHDYGKPFFDWAPDLSSVSATAVCSRCSQGVRSDSCALTWTSVTGKLTVIAAVSLMDQPYMDTKVINCTVADGKVVVSLPDAISGITIYAAGYKTDHRMEGCVSKAVTDTLMELPVSGERIKLFFLDTRTLNPVMPCLIAR